ncbi:MAG: MFS transporter [Burkholderiales bacterium]|nr:MFS transporter [Burkholderiales bacterium]
MDKRLISLTLGGLGIGITEFVIMGLLPDIAASLGVSIPTAGHFISAYALGVVVGAPLLVMFSNKIQPKKLLVILMVMFTVFNLLSAFANNYYTLILTRFLSGLPHGAFFGVGAVVASRIAERGKESQAVAQMFAGLTLANLIGVPIGTYIGHNFSWHYTFILIAMVGLVTIYCINKFLPEVKQTESRDIKSQFSYLKHLNSWLIILIIAIGTGGLFCWISYIAPLFIHVSGFEANSVSYLMAFAGLGMFVGNFMGGKLADKLNPARATLMVLIFMMLSLVLVHFCAESKVLTIIMTFTTGMAAFAIIAPVQILVINSAKGSEMLAAAVSQASFNLANALGAYLGGLPLIYGYGYTSPEFVGVGMVLGGVILTALLIKRTT